MKPRIYVCGPMSGLPDFNRIAFNHAAAQLDAAGYEPLNPASNFAGRTDLPRHVYFQRDFEMLLTADGICLLPGWEKSAGATAEHAAAVELGLYRAHVQAYLVAVVRDDVDQCTVARRKSLAALCDGDLPERSAMCPRCEKLHSPRRLSALCLACEADALADVP